MEPVVLAVIIGIAVYCVIVALIPRRILAETSDYTRNQLQQLERETLRRVPEDDSNSIFREQLQKSSLMARIFYTLPGTKRAYPRLVRGGLADNIEMFFITSLILFLLALYLMRDMGLWGFVLAVAITYFVAWMRIKRRIKKRNQTFINLFPDALDMIVRSVRSGYPLNAAVKMVADNMAPPVSTEFKKVADEIAYGSTLLEALQRLAFRIDEQEVRFFVIMLAVQQDVGGNLSEVLSNLSNIIRKRKHLRMKLVALTSEGRATAWVLGALPLVVAFAIKWVAPNHFVPLFATTLGNLVLGAAVGIYLLGAFIVWRMVNMEI